MRVLLDTNLVLDVLLRREPWLAEARALWEAGDAGRLTACIVASTLTDIFYIARKLKGLDLAHRAVQVCLEAFEICPIDRATVELAAALPGPDFEDNLQIACAVQLALDAIVTRDAEGFAQSPIPVWTPAEALSRLGT
jgi:predicted nucleic acid-binding protein